MHQGDFAIGRRLRHLALGDKPGIHALAKADLALYGASGSVQTTTGTITALSTTLTLAAAKDFKNGQGIIINHAGAAYSTGAASSITATATGATGTVMAQGMFFTSDGPGANGIDNAFATATIDWTTDQTLNFTVDLTDGSAGNSCYVYILTLRQIN